MSLAPDDERHGTRGGYVNHHCRCEECVEAHNSYMRRYLPQHRLWDSGRDIRQPQLPNMGYQPKSERLKSATVSIQN